jgi:hypothetical protein
MVFIGRNYQIHTYIERIIYMPRLLFADIENYALDCGYNLIKKNGKYLLSTILPPTTTLPELEIQVKNLQGVVDAIRYGKLLRGYTSELHLPDINEVENKLVCSYPDCMPGCKANCDRNKTSFKVLKAQATPYDTNPDLIENCFYKPPVAVEYFNDKKELISASNGIHSKVYQVVDTAPITVIYEISHLEKCLQMSHNEDVSSIQNRVVDRIKSLNLTIDFDGTGMDTYYALRYMYERIYGRYAWRHYKDLYESVCFQNDCESLHFWQSCEKLLDYCSQENLIF